MGEERNLAPFLMMALGLINLDTYQEVKKSESNQRELRRNSYNSYDVYHHYDNSCYKEDKWEL